MSCFQLDEKKVSLHVGIGRGMRWCGPKKRPSFLWKKNAGQQRKRKCQQTSSSRRKLCCLLRLHAASKSLQNTRKRFLVWGKIFSHDVQNFYFVLHPLISMSFALYSCVWRPLKREFWWRKKSCTSLKKFLRTQKSANQGYHRLLVVNGEVTGKQLQ